ncbi:putative leucine-rich repeat-containing protein DDB_G0290503 isoform X2 [Eleutherodactylus coqui]|uniref:putative leucine-rich repeat-containing protein DDB_G0290503 isoform X2 n=1 Tax=Eleutherodactylus coqui TaxID=57060 RepID=UPI003461D77B
MSYRLSNGYVSLPSRYGIGDSCQHHVDTSRRSPRWNSRDLGSNRHGLESPRHYGLSELERNIEAAGHLESDNWMRLSRDYTRRPPSPRQTDRARSVSPLRGIHALECYRNLSSPSLSRRGSLSRVSTWSPEECGNELPLSRKSWSGSEIDLRASLSESAQKRSDLVQRLREAQSKLEEQSEELKKRDKELEMSRAKTELLAVKQKQLESSISQLEKEKGWLEVSRFEDKKQRGELQDRIINLEMEVMLTKSSLENFNYTNELRNQKIFVGNDEVNRELKTARENLVYFRNCVKILEAEKNQAMEELKKLREGSQLALSQTNEANQRTTDTLRTHQNLQDALTDLQLNFNNINLEKELLSSKVLRLDEKISDLTLRLKVAQTDRERFLKEKLELHRRTEELSLELERAQKGREGFNDQVSDLHTELVGAKAQANRQDQEKVQMKEELMMLKQVNGKLTTELGQIQQSLQNALEELHQTQAEHKISSNLASALEAERKQLLEEKQMLMAAVENDDDSQSVQELRVSHIQLQEERDNVQARCHELEVALQQAHEQLGSQIQEQQQVILYWKERWQETAVSLKNTEDLLEQERTQCQETSDKVKKYSGHITALVTNNTALLEDCEMLETENEELCKLRATISRLKDENNQLTRKLKELEQSNHLEDLHRSLNESSGQTDQIKELFRELQKSHETIKELETQRSDKALEMRKLKSENGSVLRIELDACRQQLELERSQREVLQSRVGELESKLTAERRSQTSLEEVDSELTLVREELQKVWDMLRTKDTELEEQYHELESARDQYTECSTEKVRLEQLVTSLQKQVEEKDQAMKHLQQIREMEKTEMSIEKSSLELKLVEMQEQNGKVTSFNVGNVSHTKVKSWSPTGSENEASSQNCPRCEVFLQQLDKAIKGCQERNVELQEQKNQTLTSLYQLQDILKNLSKQTKVNERVAQALQIDNDTLKNQHKLVTEQLKDLFKEKQNLSNAYKKFPQEEKPADDWTEKSRLVKNVLGSVKSNKELLKDKEDLQEDLQDPSRERTEKYIGKLQRQLEEKSEKISTMTSEIKMLKEKNESLMKAKLRFQQQVQQIRSISQPGREKEPTDPTVPRLAAGSKNLHKAESGSHRSLTPVSGTQTPEGSWTDSVQSSRSSTPINISTTHSPLKLNIPGAISKNWRSHTEGSPLSPRSHEIEGAGDGQGPFTPRASALLSPRPYQPRKTM